MNMSPCKKCNKEGLIDDLPCTCEGVGKAEKIERTLDLLIAEWIEVGNYLDNDHDTSYDRAVGKTYKRCAFELRKALGA